MVTIALLTFGRQHEPTIARTIRTTGEPPHRDGAVPDARDRGAGLVALRHALLTTSTILPQMQGAMSATQDEIAWVMTFNILATAVVTPMTGWLVARSGDEARDGLVDRRVHARDLAVRHGAVAGDAGVLARDPGRHRRAGGAAVADHPARHVSAPPAPMVLVDVRHGGRGRAGVRPDPRRLPGRGLQLALGVLHARAGRGRVAASALRLTLPPDRPRQQGPARLDRLPRAVGARSPRCSSCWRAACGSTGSIRPRSWSSAWSRRVAFYVFVSHSLTTTSPFLNLRCCATATTPSGWCW